jgi:glycosyltransferase involved in cell wall biosynthesis
MRVLQVIDSVDPASGGPLEGVRQLAAALSAEGHVTEVASADAPAGRWVRDFPVALHALGPARGGPNGYAPRLGPWLAANAGRYDAVVVNGIWNYAGFATWRAARRTGTPYFVYTHGMLDPWFRRRYPLKHLKKSLFWPWAVYPVLRDARAVLFTCEEERRLARESFRPYRCREQVVGHGSPGPQPPGDRRSAFLARHPTLAGRRALVFLGRVHPKKGADLVLEALPRLVAEGRFDRARDVFVIAGPAEGAYAEALRAQARRLRIDDCVHWTGLLLGDEKWGALQGADAFVLPSHQENFGIAVVEALSVGVPVLISRAVNIWPEIVADGTGLACDDTAESCYRTLADWYSRPEPERAAMRAAARACFEARFTIERAARRLAEVLAG